MMYDVQHGQPPRQKTNNSLVEVPEPSFLSLIDFIDTLFQCGFHAFQNITCDTAIWDINDIVQGGRSWQPFGECKNGHKIFCQARSCYFCKKCVVFALNCNLPIEFSSLYNIYHVIVHSLPKKHCFCPSA